MWIADDANSRVLEINNGPLITTVVSTSVSVSTVTGPGPTITVPGQTVTQVTTVVSTVTGPLTTVSTSPNSTSNLLGYIGAGVVGLVVGAAAVFFFRRRNKTG